ncbi:MAG: hypothetical protein OHK0022_10240 [Roseiflexaceae bacterium]
MADPAWSDDSASSRRLFRQRRSRSARTRRSGRWLSLLNLLTPGGARARFSAAQARAALDQLPDDLPAALPVTPKLRLYRPQGPPSLRHASHALTVVLVFVVVALVGTPPSESPAFNTMQRVALGGTINEQRVSFRLDREAVPLADQNDFRAPGAALPLPSPFREIHVLREGETLGQLAERYNVSVEALFWSNELDRSDLLVDGQEFRIPRVSGTIHLVAEGETLASIADTYKVAPEVLTLVPSNRLTLEDTPPVGRELFVPGGTRPYPAELVARYGDERGIARMRVGFSGVVREGETNLRSGPARGYPRVASLDAGDVLRPIARHAEWLKVSAGTAGEGWVRADLLDISPGVVAVLPETNDFPPLPPRWVWPARGRLTSPFGWRRIPFRSYHDGIDIANAAGTKIFAARAGTVTEAGWCSGFGYCVKINHGEGIVTIYGHLLKRPPVVAGDKVEAGDLIGLMGSTYDRSGGGYSTGVHLHFTIKINGKAVDPLLYLP